MVYRLSRRTSTSSTPLMPLSGAVLCALVVAMATPASAAPQGPQAIEADAIWDGTYVKDRVMAMGASPALNDMTRSLSSGPTAPDEPAPAGPEASFEATYHRVENSGHVIFVVVQTFADADALHAYWQAYSTEDWTVSEEHGHPVFTYVKQAEDGSGYRNKTTHIGRYVLAAKQLHAGEDYLAAFEAYREQIESLE